MKCDKVSAEFANFTT